MTKNSQHEAFFSTVNDKIRSKEWWQGATRDDVRELHSSLLRRDLPVLRAAKALGRMDKESEKRHGVDASDYGHGITAQERTSRDAHARGLVVDQRHQLQDIYQSITSDAWWARATPRDVEALHTHLIRSDYTHLNLIDKSLRRLDKECKKRFGVDASDYIHGATTRTHLSTQATGRDAASAAFPTPRPAPTSTSAPQRIRRDSTTTQAHSHHLPGNGGLGRD